MDIKLKDVKKNYKLGRTIVEALRGIELDIKEGDFIAIMGPSGSGKSTIMNIVGCVSGIMPAIQASRLKPVDALRYE